MKMILVTFFVCNFAYGADSVDVERQILGVSIPNSLNVEKVSSPVEDFAVVIFKEKNIISSAYIGNHPDKKKWYFPDDLSQGEIFIGSRQLASDEESIKSFSVIILRSSCKFPRFVQMSVNPQNISSAIVIAKKIKIDCTN